MPKNHITFRALPFSDITKCSLYSLADNGITCRNEMAPAGHQLLQVWGARLELSLDSLQ